MGSPALRLSALSFALSACSASNDSSGPGNTPLPSTGPGFGSGSDVFDHDAASTDPEPPVFDGGVGTREVTFVHGILNLGAVQVCYRAVPPPNSDDSDNADARGSRGERSTEGPSASLLVQAEAFGDHGPLTSPLPWTSGVLSLHWVPEPSFVPDAGSPPMDAQVDPEHADAGLTEQDAGAPTIDCAQSTQLASFSLKPNDVLQASQLMLIASGLVLDSARLAEIGAERKAAFQVENPEASEQQADLAATNAIHQAIERIGPQLRLEAAPALAIPPGTLRLSLTHLVPDVASTSVLPGALRLCITAGTLEGAVMPPLSEPALTFRSQTWLTTPYERDVSYRFRVFGASRFEAAETGAINQDCATTGLVPLADLTVPPEAHAQGQVLNLIFSGAMAPSALCAPATPHAIVQAGCPTPIDGLAPSLRLLSTPQD